MISGFLKQRTWVDFRSGLDNQNAFRRLVAGIKGRWLNRMATNCQLNQHPTEVWRGLKPSRRTTSSGGTMRFGDSRFAYETTASLRSSALLGVESPRWRELVCGLIWLCKRSRNFAIAKSFHAFRAGDAFRALAEQIAIAVRSTDRVTMVDDLAERLKTLLMD